MLFEHVLAIFGNIAGHGLEAMLPESFCVTWKKCLILALMHKTHSPTNYHFKASGCVPCIRKDGIWNSMFGFVVSTMLQLISTIKIYK